MIGVMIEQDPIDGLRWFLAEHAWRAALNHRGISASVNVDRVVGLLEEIGDVELVAFAKDPENYPSYGAPILAAACRKYGVALPDCVEAERMSRGEMCSLGCEEGC